MGINYLIVNMDKKEYIDPSKVGKNVWSLRIRGLVSDPKMLIIYYLIHYDWRHDRVILVSDPTDLWGEVYENYTNISHRALKDYEEYLEI